SSASPTGVVIRSKYGSPTESCLFWIASAMRGDTVPSSTTKARAADSRVLGRNADSRGTGEAVGPGVGGRSPRPAVGAAPSGGEGEGGRGEGVDRVKDPGRGQERAEDRETERRDDQREVPDAQHPAPFLHHHRVDERGRGEPRQQRRVLDRVPRPVPAPAEHLV